MTNDHINTDPVLLPFANVSDDEFHIANADLINNESSCDAIVSIFETFEYSEQGRCDHKRTLILNMAIIIIP